MVAEDKYAVRLGVRGVPQKYIRQCASGFRPEKHQRAAYRSIQKVTEGFVASRNVAVSTDNPGLLLIGKPGTGKTSLLCHALYLYVREHDLRSFRMVRMDYVVSCIKEGTIKLITSPLVLVVDDVDLSEIGKFDRSVLSVLQERADKSRPTLMASSVSQESMRHWCGGKFASWAAGSAVTHSLSGVDMHRTKVQAAVARRYS